MANNRMYFFNTRTKQQVYIAKYYPSTGWYFTVEVEQVLGEAFNKADFGDLTEEQLKENAAHKGLGVPHTAISSPIEGAEWELRFEYHPDKAREIEF